MRPLFDDIRALGEAAIARLVSDRCQEQVDLEFKTKRDHTHGRLESDDKAALGKALSAFSNSAGGLIVYGVLAVECQPILELIAFGRK